MASIMGIALLAQTSGDGWFDRFTDELTGRSIVGSVAILAVGLGLWLAIARLGRRAAARLADRRAAEAPPAQSEEVRQRILTLWTLVRRILAVFLIAIVLLTLLAWWSIPIGPFLAVGGVVGVAVGFGAQSLIKDIIAGLFIVSENQYSIGDVVRLGDVSGKVEDIRLRVTVLRDLEGSVFYVPNGTITVATNLTQEFSAVVIDVAVAYGEDVDRVMDVLGQELAAFRSTEDWGPSILEDPQILGVNNLGNWGVDIRLQVTVLADLRWQAKRELLRRIKIRLDAEGIEIPFPYTTLVPGDPEAWRAVLGP